jgi:hypothetical protein
MKLQTINSGGVKSGKHKVEGFKSLEEVIIGQITVDEYLAKTRLHRCDNCGRLCEHLIEIGQLDDEQYHDKYYCEFCLAQQDKVGIEH